MKKTLIITALITGVFSFSQSVFDKYEDMENVVSMVVNEKMFGMLSQMNVGDNDPNASYIQMIKSLKSLNFLTTDDPKTAALLGKDINKYIQTSGMQELMRIRENEGLVQIYVLDGKDANHFSELLMFVKGKLPIDVSNTVTNTTINLDSNTPKTLMVHIIGEVDLRQVKGLTSQLNIPIGNSIKTNDE